MPKAVVHRRNGGAGMERELSLVLERNELKETLKRPYMRKCNTQLRCPSPILMKFGPEVGFGPKPAPDKKILDFDPKNGVILGSEG